MQDKTPGISLHHKAESSLQVDCSNQVWLELFQAPFVQLPSSPPQLPVLWVLTSEGADSMPWGELTRFRK